MRIGIDGREITLKRTGVHRYLDVFLNGIEKEHNVEIHIFLPERPIEKIQRDWISYHFSPCVHPDPYWGHFVLPRLLEKMGIDVFFSPYYKMPYGLKIPSAVTVHDILPLRFPEKRPGLNTVYKRFFRFQLSYALKNSSVIFTDSNYVREELERLFPCSRGKIVCNPIPVDDKFYKSGKSPHFQFSYILYVGNLSPHKNIPTLIRAYSFLNKDDRSDVHLVISGKNEKLFNLCRKLHIEDTVHFCGFIADDQLPGYYHNSLFVVHPSYEEGYGLPVLEANAAGRAVIASKTSSLPEVGGKASLYFPPDDEVELTKLLYTLIHNSDLLTSLEEKAVKNARRISRGDFVNNILKGLKGIKI